MNSLLVLADDLTGALDSAGRLARPGRTVPVWINLPDFQNSSAVSVVDLHTRHADSESVRERVRQAAVAARGSGFEILYLKLDSTLRGPVGESLLAAREGWQTSSILFCPAFPPQGRTVTEGRLLVKGVPVDLTQFGRDGRNPVPHASLTDFLQKTGMPLHHIPLEHLRADRRHLREILASRPALWTADAQTESDLRRLAWAAVEGGITLLAGSAGLVKYLRPQVIFKETVPPPPARAGEGKTLFVVGSRHPRARQQVLALQKRLTGQGLLVSAHDLPDQPGREDEIAQNLAGRILEIAKTEPIAALVVVGGDTARAVVDMLGITFVLVSGEVLAGIPRAVIGDGTLAGTRWISKAGGFGRRTALVQIAEWLQCHG
jgi:uncharacterized protein YgbK (DUF1537 family)